MCELRKTCKVILWSVRTTPSNHQKHDGAKTFVGENNKWMVALGRALNMPFHMAIQHPEVISKYLLGIGDHLDVRPDGRFGSHRSCF